MLKLKILQMTTSDVAEVLEIEKLSFSLPWSKQSFISAIQNKDYYLICAKALSRTVGYAGMYKVAGCEGYILNVAVDKEFRKMKVGTTMINSLLEYSKINNLEFLSLEVRESNDIAIKLYKKCGFEIVGIRKNFYSYPQENALIMTNYLK